MTRADNFVSPGGVVRRRPSCLRAGRPDLQLNQWALDGRLDRSTDEQPILERTPAARIAYRFHARDLHLVLGPGATASRCASAY